MRAPKPEIPVEAVVKEQTSEERISNLCAAVPGIAPAELQKLLNSEIDAITLVASDDKAIRTAWHAAVRDNFAGVLGTSAKLEAVSNGGVAQAASDQDGIPQVQAVKNQRQLVIIERFNKKSHSNRRGNFGNNRGKEWDQGEYCHFTLCRLKLLSNH